jgi:hypothetical protein
MPVQILPSKNIDEAKWDECVRQNANGLIYSQYNYLNVLSDNWHGLVVNDYKAVMALPWRKKIGIRYYYQPAFIQQLGLIGEADKDIVASIESFCKYGDMFFNYTNWELTTKLNTAPKVNLVIDLSKGYESISANYKKDLIQNISKAEKENFQYSGENKAGLAIEMYRLFYEARMPHVSKTDYNNFKQLCIKLESAGMCFTRQVTKDDELLSIGLFLKDEKRIYNLMNTTTDIGRQKEANPFLLDAVIKEFSNHNLFFDFEGSDIPGVKSFYEKFGAVNQPYFHYHHNKLPGILKLLKK